MLLYFSLYIGGNKVMNEWDFEKEIIVFEVSFVIIRKYVENS